MFRFLFRYAFLAMVIFVLFLGQFSYSAFASLKDEASVEIEKAEGIVSDCYRAVWEAEKAGANVSELLVKLNEAGEFLSKAHLAYSVGDFVSAIDLAVKCQDVLNGFAGEAFTFRDVAARERYLDFMVNVVGSSIGAVAIVCGGFVVWFYLKKREEAKGEVTSES